MGKSLFYQYVMLTCGLAASISLHVLYNLIYSVVPMLVEATVAMAMHLKARPVQGQSPL